MKIERCIGQARIHIVKAIDTIAVAFAIFAFAYSHYDAACACMLVSIRMGVWLANFKNEVEGHDKP